MAVALKSPKREAKRMDMGSEPPAAQEIEGHAIGLSPPDAEAAVRAVKLALNRPASGWLKGFGPLSGRKGGLSVKIKRALPDVSTLHVQDGAFRLGVDIQLNVLRNLPISGEKWTYLTVPTVITGTIQDHKAKVREVSPHPAAIERFRPLESL